MKQYYYFYKITNMINNHYYYGIHSTNKLDDGYMGSGTRLHLAYEKYGIENFQKDILCFFDSWEELCDYERQIVNQELVDSAECYNLVLGGHTPKEIDFYYNGEKVSEKIMGEKNGSYGSKWMMKDGISKKVISSDIEKLYTFTLKEKTLEKFSEIGIKVNLDNLSWILTYIFFLSSSAFA